MTDQIWIPKVGIDLAYKWSNCDTYWDITVMDLADTQQDISIPARPRSNSNMTDYPLQLKRKYPLTYSGQARRSRLHDSLERDLSIRTTIEQLIDQLRNYTRTRNWSDARTLINQIESICLGLQSGLQTTEARMEAARAYRTMGENVKAIEVFETCIKEFQSSDRHSAAIARWITGYIQLETPRTSFNDGMVNWQKCWEFFRPNIGNNNLSADEVKWYAARAEMMFEDIQNAIKYGGIHHASTSTHHTTGNAASPSFASFSAPLDDDNPTRTVSFDTAVGDRLWWNSAGEAIEIVNVVNGSAPGVIVKLLDGKLFPQQGNIPAGQTNFISISEFKEMIDTGDLTCLPPRKVALNNLSEDASNWSLDAKNRTGDAVSFWGHAWLRFKNIPIHESIRAHPKGGIVTKKSDDFVEANTVWINNKEYRLYSATARRVITLNPDPKVEYSFIHVEGDSMIEAVPNPIMNGDYVLVWITPEPGNERIVVALYHDPQTDDVTGAVKLKRSDGLHSKNSAKNYPIVPLENVKSYVGEVIAIAKPL